MVEMGCLCTNPGMALQAHLLLPCAAATAKMAMPPHVTGIH